LSNHGKASHPMLVDAPNSRSDGRALPDPERHSVVRRIDYGKTTRAASLATSTSGRTALLLKNTKGGEFACDVAKACHHGSEDVSSTFLEEMRLLATMFSQRRPMSPTHTGRPKVLGDGEAFFRKDMPQRQNNSYLGLTQKIRHVAPLIDYSRSCRARSSFSRPMRRTITRASASRSRSFRPSTAVVRVAA